MKLLKKIIAKFISSLGLNRLIFKLKKKKNKNNKETIQIANLDIDVLKSKLASISPCPNGEVFCTNNIIKPCLWDLMIIVPSYNMAEFLPECLDSIVSQETKYKFKVLVINDGSTDNTPKVLDNYRGNPYVFIIDQENKGFSGARNVALNYIDSKYIMFVDADDYLLPGAVEGLLNSAFLNDADIVQGNHYNFLNNGLKVKKTKLKDKKGNPFGSIGGYPWAKVFKSDLFENLGYPEGYWYEDTMIPYILFLKCEDSSYTVSNFVYAHRVNFKGITLTSNKFKKSVDSYWIVEKMLQELPRYQIEICQPLYEQTLYQLYRNYDRCKYLTKEDQKLIFVMYVKLFRKYFSGYKTQKSYMHQYLEEAVNNVDFELYENTCKYL